MENTNTQTINPTPVITVDKVRVNNSFAIDETKFTPQSTKTIIPNDLLQALYKIWDAFERANVEFFLVGDTYYAAKANRDLTGDRVTVGIRKNEWISGGRRLIDAFITPVSETEDMALYEFEGVPVEVRVYKDSDCILNCDTINYRYESFKTPNPYSEFVKQYA